MKIKTFALLLVSAFMLVPFGSVPTKGTDEEKDSSVGGKVITNSIGMKLAYIPAGRFLMGSPPSEKERAANEKQHEVTISKPYYMGVYEVTQAQFATIMAGKPKERDRKPSHFEKLGEGYPVEQVLWREAVEFCRLLSETAEEKRAGRTYRLPTEAEWEYACRADTTTAFHHGNSLSSRQANCNGKNPCDAEEGPYLRRTTRVGSFKPNAFGLYDMHGNVWEWCSDWYDPEYYEKSPATDPKGPEKGVLPTGYENDYYLVVRGGSWLDDARGCRSARRFRFMPSDRYRIVGFRVVCEVSK